MSASGAGTISAANGVAQAIDLLPCSTVVVRVETDSAAPLLVNVPALHGSDWHLLRAGEVEAFRRGWNELTRVNVKGSGGTATGRYAVVSQTTFQAQ